MSDLPIARIAIIGFGEAGGILAADFAALGVDVSVFDVLLCAEASREAMIEKARVANVRAHDRSADAIRGAGLVISAVTASAAIDAAKASAPSLERGQIFLDLNSVSPETKRAIASHIGASEAHFVEAAVMGPLPPQRLKVPMLLGGAHAVEAARRLGQLGMNATAASEHVGVASAIKMCRSIVIKGLEALAVESLFAARRYGAEDAVLASLEATYPLSIPFQGYGLNITITSYAGTLNFGFIGCRHVLPRLQRLAVYAGDAADDLERAHSMYS